MHIVLTGVTRGIGRAMAVELTRLGHRVSGCGRSAEQIESLSREIAGTFDVVDVVDDGAVRAWAESVLKESGPPDLLVNNAALANDLAPLWEVPREQFDQIVDVNIKGVANVIRHFVPAMVARRTGVIVNISSGWGRSVDAQVAPYCATKYAIEGLTKALALELPEGMAAVPWSPGIIDTAMLRQTFGGGAKKYLPPEEWAKKAVPELLKLGPRENGKSVQFTS